MIWQKLPQKMFSLIFVLIVSIGCATPIGTPIPLATSTKTSTPVPTITPNPTLTPKKISTFEECSVGGLIQGIYPRQCTTDKGESFTEPLEQGVIFSRTYGSSTTNSATGSFITSTRDGGYLVTGQAYDGCWVLKLDASWEKQWEHSFAQELHQVFQLYNNEFNCVLARQTSDGGYVIMGQEYDIYSWERRGSFFTIILDKEGNWVSGQIIAEKMGKIPYLDQEGNLIRLTSIDPLGRVTETSDGGYIIVSQYPKSSPDSRTHLTKTDENGNYVWDRNLCLDKSVQQAEEKQIVCSHNSYTYVWDVIQLKDGSFAVTGVTNGAWLLKTDADGNVEWIRPYPKGAGHALIQLPDEGFFIAGRLQGDGLLIKTDSKGNMQWSKTFAGTFEYDAFMAMEQRPNGKITIMGNAPNSGSAALWLLGIDSTLLK